MLIYEIIGYVGTAFVLVSFLLTNVIRLRVVNMIGGFITLIYGILIKASPTILMNGALLIINGIQLIKYFKNTNEYSVLTMNESDNYYQFFLKRYINDITEFFPNAGNHEECNYIKAVLHDEKIVGILMGNRHDDELDVYVDYAVPAYRDCSVGQYLYTYLPQDGIKYIVLTDETKNHDEYLKKLGFQNENGKYTKSL